MSRSTVGSTLPKTTHHSALRSFGVAIRITTFSEEGISSLTLQVHGRGSAPFTLGRRTTRVHHQLVLHSNATTHTASKGTYRLSCSHSPKPASTNADTLLPTTSPTSGLSGIANTLGCFRCCARLYSKVNRWPITTATVVDDMPQRRATQTSLPTHDDSNVPHQAQHVVHFRAQTASSGSRSPWD